MIYWYLWQKVTLQLICSSIIHFEKSYPESNKTTSKVNEVISIYDLQKTNEKNSFDILRNWQIKFNLNLRCISFLDIKASLKWIYIMSQLIIFDINFTRVTPFASMIWGKFYIPLKWWILNLSFWLVLSEHMFYYNAAKKVFQILSGP